MDSSRDFLEYKSLRSLNKLKKDIKENDENSKRDSIKLNGDKAFLKGKFKEAYDLYCQALAFDEKNYDIITCKIGAALNLGYIDEVFQSSELLIKLSDKKPQGYYLKAIAHDAVFQFEIAISLFMEALKLENENQTVVIKSMKQTVAKFIDCIDMLREEDGNDMLALLKMADVLVKHRKYSSANLMLKYFQALNNDDRELRLMMFKNFGRIFKAEKKYDKAVIAFEEAFYLACVLEKLQSKIEIIASMTSCYLKQQNMHKVVVYYHKMLDIELDLKRLSTELLNENMNVNLRLAIRQNLYSANLRLGKLYTCCHNLADLIEIIDENLHGVLNSQTGYNELLKTKLSTAVELAKLYIIEKSYFELDSLLKSHLKFIEENSSPLADKETLKYYEIKLIAYMGLSAASVNQARMSKICTKKALCKINVTLKELEHMQEARNELPIMKQYLTLQVECLLIASDTCAKRIEVKRETHQYYEHKNLDEVDDMRLDENEIQKDSELRVSYAKEAFLKSRTLIDPSIRMQSTHALGLSLYDSQFYQSASYYFNEALSISKTLFKPPTSYNDEFNLNDAIPDLHLESTVYWVSCQILTQYTRMSLSGTQDEHEKRKIKTELESLLNKLLKAYSKLESSVKLQKLNRLKNLNYTTVDSLRAEINSDKDLSDRWKGIFELCIDCLLFLCYKLEKYEDCVFYYENSQYLIHMDADYISNHLEYFYSPTKPPTTSFSLTTNTNTESSSEMRQQDIQDDRGEIKTSFNNFNDFQTIVNDAGMPVILYRFAFNCKLLYIFIIEPENGIVLQSELKIKDLDITKGLLNAKEKDTQENLSLMFANELAFLSHKFDLYQNDFVKRNIDKIENRSIPSKFQRLIDVRNANHERDKRFRQSLFRLANSLPSSIAARKHAVTIQSESSSNKYEQVPYRHPTLHTLSHSHEGYVSHVTATNTINDDIETSDVDFEHFKIDYSQLINDGEVSSHHANNLADKSEPNSSVIKTELKQVIMNLLKFLFLKPIQAKINNYYDQHKVVNFSTNYTFTKLLIYSLNVNSINDSEFRIPNYLCSIESVYLLANASIISNKREKEDEFNMNLMRDAIAEGPERVKNIVINPSVLKIEKENIKPRLTSNPRLAVNKINEHPDEPYVCVDNSQYLKLMQRYDQSVSTLISETVTKTNVKRSNLEILNYYQLSDTSYKTYSIGCPHLPPKYENLSRFKKGFLAYGFEELTTVSKILHCEPVFTENATKIEFLTQLTHSAVIHLTTYSSNDLDSFLVFSPSNKFQPHLTDETDKYCVITCDDLNSVYLDKCKLIILSCYSLKHHQPRFDLARKLLKRGCRAVLLVLTPLPNTILNEFYKLFYNNVNKAQYLAVAYSNAMNELIKNLNLDEDDYDLIISSLCLISSTNVEVSIDHIGKNMLQLKIDTSLDKYKYTTSKRNLLNYEPKANFMNVSTDLEKVLLQLQMELKLLLNELINIVTSKSVDDFVKFRDIFNYISDLISKSIEYTKSEIIQPEPLSTIINKNKAAINILTCLGFNFQASSVEASSVEESETPKIANGYNRAFITFPNSRFLDLNLRMSHVVTSINDLIFKDPSTFSGSESISVLTQSSTTIMTNLIEMTPEQFISTYAHAMSNFHALLPIEDKKLLSCLIDILALTKFSPEILLSITDFSVDYVINYYKKKNVEIRDNMTRSSGRTLYTSSMDHSLLQSVNPGRNSAVYTKNQELRKYQKIDISNKIVNFLYSIGYEIIGVWLRFKDVQLNRRLLDYVLKILTSFSTDRDMSLYRELNVSVLGQRSANAKVFPCEAKMYSLNPVILPNSNVTMIGQWANVPESHEEVQKKLRFTDKFTKLSKRRSNQRIDVLKHHLNYAAKQQDTNNTVHKLDDSEYSANTQLMDSKLKYYSGGNPIKDRKMVNEKIPLTLEQLDQIREYSHYLCRKRLDKIDIEHNEKLEKLVLPYIANNFK